MEQSRPVKAFNGITLPFYVTGMVWIGFPIEPHEGIWDKEPKPHIFLMSVLNGNCNIDMPTALPPEKGPPFPTKSKMGG
jgi:hypothetical protein